MGSLRTKLEVEGLSLSWDGMLICEDISFKVREGELACLVGRSGSGKTTIFHAIAGLVTPEKGRILLDGEDVSGHPGRISYMLQKDLLLDEHTIADNVSMPLRIAGASRREARDAAIRMLPEFGLSGTESLYPSQLSGGMRQRAALLRTHLAKNDVVLMDEPFSALDAFTRAELRRWFLEMLSSLGMTSMMVTHDVDEAVAMADRVFILGARTPYDRVRDGSEIRLEDGGTPHYEPSIIKGVVKIDIPRSQRAEFALSDDAFEFKRRILGMLGEGYSSL